MSWEYAIDPITKDWIDDGNGGFLKTETSAVALHHQIHIKRGSWWGHDGVGGEIPTLARSKSTLQTPAIIADMFRELAKPLVDEGRITAPVSTLTRELGNVTGDVSVTDRKTAQQIRLSELLPLSP